MWIVVMGLMMLTGAVVREQGQGVDDFGWRRGGQQSEWHRVTVAVKWVGGDRDCGSADGYGVDERRRTAEGVSTQSTVEGAWDLACESKRGNHMVFDRESIREIGSTTLFRWAAADGAPESEDAVYTAVADCTAKSIEAHWPGKRTATRAGPAGGISVEAVCAARSALALGKQTQDGLRGRPGARLDTGLLSGVFFRP
jgi:hypothetical protein